MSQSVQAVEQGVGQVIEENLMAQGQLLGITPASFTFDKSPTSTRTVPFRFSPPNGNDVSTIIVLQSFNVGYSEEDYEIENLQISLRVGKDTNGNPSAFCTATLRDRNFDTREWQGTVTGLLMFFGNAA